MTDELSRIDDELAAAEEELQAAFDGQMSGPSGWRAQAMAHVKQSRILLRRHIAENLQGPPDVLGVASREFDGGPCLRSTSAPTAR